MKTNNDLFTPEQLTVLRLKYAALRTILATQMTILRDITTDAPTAALRQLEQADIQHLSVVATEELTHRGVATPAPLATAPAITLPPRELNTNKASFIAALTTAYTDLFANDPEYAYSAARCTPSGLAHKMANSLAEGHADYKGAGIRRACKALGVKQGKKTIMEFLNA